MQISWLTREMDGSKRYNTKSFLLPDGAQRTLFYNDGAESICSSDNDIISAVTEELFEAEGQWWYRRFVEHHEVQGKKLGEVEFDVPDSAPARLAAAANSLWGVNEPVIESTDGVETIWVDGVVVFDKAIDGGK